MATISDRRSTPSAPAGPSGPVRKASSDRPENPPDPEALRTKKDVAGKGVAMAAGAVGGRIAAGAIARTVAGGGNPLVGLAVEYGASTLLERAAERRLNGRETSLSKTLTEHLKRQLPGKAARGRRSRPRLPVIRVVP